MAWWCVYLFSCGLSLSTSRSILVHCDVGWGYSDVICNCYIPAGNPLRACSSWNQLSFWIIPIEVSRFLVRSRSGIVN